LNSVSSEGAWESLLKNRGSCFAMKIICNSPGGFPSYR